MKVVCDGYFQLTTLSSEAIAIANPVEKRSYFYFHRETLPQLCSFSEHNFWDQLIPQGGHSEPALRQVLVAIGAFHELVETRGPESRIVRQQVADSMYQQAIARVVSELSGMSIASVLMASILLAFLDNLKGNMWNAHKHITSAAAIVDENRRGNGTRSLLISKVLAPIISQLNSVLGGIYALSPVGSANDDSFMGFLDAHDQLYATVEEIQLQLRSSTSPNFRLLDQLEDWHQRFFQFLTDSNGSTCECSWPDSRVHHALGTLFLETVFLLARAKLHSALTGLDVTLDQFEDDFRRAVKACEQMVQILSSSITDLSTSARDCLGFRPVYFMNCLTIIEGCRDPVLRRRAIFVLRQRHEANAFWDTYCVAEIAEGFVDYEERASPIQPVRCAADIPESARTHLLIVSGFKIDNKTGNFSLMSDFSRSDMLKVVVPRHSQSPTQSDVIMDAFWMARTPAGRFTTIPLHQVPGALTTGTPTAIGGLFPQASTPSNDRLPTKLWSLLDETRTGRDHLNEWRWKLAHPPWDRVQRKAQGVSTDQSLGTEGVRLKERTLGVQLRTIHV